MELNLLGDYGKLSYFGDKSEFCENKARVKKQICDRRYFKQDRGLILFVLAIDDPLYYVIVITGLMNEILAAELNGYWDSFYQL